MVKGWEFKTSVARGGDRGTSISFYESTHGVYGRYSSRRLYVSVELSVDDDQDDDYTVGVTAKGSFYLASFFTARMDVEPEVTVVCHV